ncbi:MAG: inositol monophosphatase [Deltaproteobacteria bacterium]|nr:inositol monophosphatase [Deltaproteobacteria bacterium]MBN2672426.1 inositol monophosphatase [Deltaproteobacteria bacterium]
MGLTSTQMSVLLHTAVDVSRAAGKVLMNYVDMNLTVRRKQSGSIASTVVTEADIHSQRVIIDGLRSVSQRYDIALLSEEAPDDGARFEKEYFWCIDPLDGTLPFIEKSKGWSVVISLVNRLGEPQIGVIFDAYNNTSYTAMIGHGCYRNDTPWRYKPNCSPVSLPMLTAVFDRSTLEHSSFPMILSELNKMTARLGYAHVNAFCYGGAAMNAMTTLTYPHACYFKFPRKSDSGGSIWDYAASACIYRERGSWVSDMFGHSLDLNRIDSTFLNHRGILFATESNIAAAVLDTFKDRFQDDV